MQMLVFPFAIVCITGYSVFSNGISFFYNITNFNVCFRQMGIVDPASTTFLPFTASTSVFLKLHEENHDIDFRAQW